MCEGPTSKERATPEIQPRLCGNRLLLQPKNGRKHVSEPYAQRNRITAAYKLALWPPRNTSRPSMLVQSCAECGDDSLKHCRVCYSFARKMLRFSILKAAARNSEKPRAPCYCSTLCSVLLTSALSRKAPLSGMARLGQVLSCTQLSTPH